MHKKYAAEGFVAVSVSLDNPKDEKARARVNEFLQGKDATMTNLIAADNDEDKWYAEDKLKAGGLPLVFIFDRQNHRVKKLEGEVDYKAIEAEVVKLLKK